MTPEPRLALILAVYLGCIYGAISTIPSTAALPYGAFSWLGGATFVLFTQGVLAHRRKATA